MTLKENYLNEISLLKNERIQRVIEAAKIEFNEHGIKNAKLRIIAKRAKVGEASIYRYFKDKTDLIKIVALSYWQNHANLFDDYYYGKVVHKENGLKKIEQDLIREKAEITHLIGWTDKLLAIKEAERIAREV